jgi:ferredoxin--NADP+ reductase
MTQDTTGHGTSTARALRAAVIGAGPAGFYAAEHLLQGKHEDAKVETEVDLFERLPFPFGLVRSGVAPDHQGIKKVTKAFSRIASNPKLRFFGNVAVGRDVRHEELLEHYDQVIYTVGAATDRSMGIPGEDLKGSHAATAFVGWYNGHPDYAGESFDLSSKRAIVVGLGNVAMDVARILIRDPEELAETDIAPYALDALRQSKVEEVVLLGRRGPAQAAFTPREIKDIAELSGVQLFVDGGSDAVSPDESLTGNAKQNVDFLSEVANAEPDASATRRVRLRFLTSPVEVLGDGNRMTAVRIERNELVDAGDGRLKARGTGETETIEAGLILRSIGYRGVASEGVPFDERSGTIPNEAGRVLTAPGGEFVPGVYTAGWIKRGPSGLIGTNKGCAKESAACMLADAEQRTTRELPPRDAISELLSSRSVRVISFDDWKKLDELELATGAKQGKVREKFSNIDEVLGVLG